MPLVELNNVREFEQLDSSEKPVLAYFSTPSCSVCHALRPKVEALLESKGLDGVYVDTMKIQELVGRLLVFSVPTVIILAGGREVARLSRILSMSELEFVLERSQAELDAARQA